MHVGHINVNDEKMAKSTGNFILVKDLLDKYSGNDLRWLMYQSQYQSPINFSFELLDQTKHDFHKLVQQINNGYVQMILNGIPDKPLVGEVDEEFLGALSEDLNFPNAVVLL
jgi:cysteinyl-tRNA synthetase